VAQQNAWKHVHHIMDQFQHYFTCSSLNPRTVGYRSRQRSQGEITIEALQRARAEVIHCIDLFLHPHHNKATKTLPGVKQKQPENFTTYVNTATTEDWSQHSDLGRLPNWNCLHHVSEWRLASQQISMQ
jgi:hypothetical protein